MDYHYYFQDVVRVSNIAGRDECQCNMATQFKNLKQKLKDLGSDHKIDITSIHEAIKPILIRVLRRGYIAVHVLDHIVRIQITDTPLSMLRSWLNGLKFEFHFDPTTELWAEYVENLEHGTTLKKMAMWKYSNMPMVLLSKGQRQVIFDEVLTSTQEDMNQVMRIILAIVYEKPDIQL